MLVQFCFLISLFANLFAHLPILSYTQTFINMCIDAHETDGDSQPANSETKSMANRLW